MSTLRVCTRYVQSVTHTPSVSYTTHLLNIPSVKARPRIYILPTRVIIRYIMTAISLSNKTF